MDDYYFEVEESTPLLPEQQVGDAPQVELEQQGPRPPSRRKRVTQIGLVLAAVVVVALLLRNVIAPSGSLFPGRSAITPQASAAPPTMLIASNINFGTVSINGRRQRGSVPMFFMPRNTTYTITLVAPPFRPVSCTVTFPAIESQGPDSASPDCALGVSGIGSPVPITINGVTAAPASTLEFLLSASDLPPDQQSQINTLLAPSVAAQQTTTVPAGSYIATRLNADNTITSQRVSTSLRGTAFQVASTDFGPYIFPCTGLICQVGMDPQQFDALTGKLWVVGVPVALRWRFTTPAGRVVGDVTFQVASMAEELLAYSPDSGWGVSPQYVSGPLNAGDSIGGLDCQTGSIVAQQQSPNVNGYFNIVTGQGIEGCKVILQDTAGTNRGTFIWRFGVLMAADGASHRLLPKLPIAPAAEVKAVQG